MVTGGQLVRLAIDGEEYDPVGDFTLRQSKIKYDESETTRKKTYFTAAAQGGMIAGQIANLPGIDLKALQEAKEVPVYAEEANGREWSGTMTYTADGDLSLSDGNIPIEMMGEFQPI